MLPLPQNLRVVFEPRMVQDPACLFACGPPPRRTRAAPCPSDCSSRMQTRACLSSWGAGCAGVFRWWCPCEHQPLPAGHHTTYACVLCSCFSPVRGKRALSSWACLQQQRRRRRQQQQHSSGRVGCYMFGGCGLGAGYHWLMVVPGDEHVFMDATGRGMQWCPGWVQSKQSQLVQAISECVWARVRWKVMDAL
jgi:hypothetical protein